eukprot:440955-Amphidinium_carterae.2
MSVNPGHLGTAGRRVTSTRSDSARPEAPSAECGRGSLRLIALRESKVGLNLVEPGTNIMI